MHCGQHKQCRTLVDFNSWSRYHTRKQSMKIFDTLAAAMTVSDASAEEGDGHLRTELDSHANMPVVG